MDNVESCSLPSASLLNQLRDEGAFTDCYSVVVPANVTLAEYVEAFYTTGVFKLERLLILLFAFKSSSDIAAAELAAGLKEHFAAWRVEHRRHNQILLADHSGRTRSWLMVLPSESGAVDASTTLLFGSALVPRVDPRTGEKRFGPVFRMLLGFHAKYSKLLLRAAALKLSRRPPSHVFQRDV